MAARPPFTDEQMESFRKALRHCAEARREIDRAERVGVNVERHRSDLDRAEKMISAVVHEYGDRERP